MATNHRLPSAVRRLVSLRDLLILVATFSVLTLYVTFQMGPASVHMPSYVEQSMIPQLTQTTSSSPDNWLLLLCMTFSDGDAGLCMDRKEVALLQRYQRVNRLPGIYDILCKKDSLCSVMSEARKIPGIDGEKWYPLCFLLPSQYHLFVSVARRLGDSGRWLIKSHSTKSGYSGPRLFDIFTPAGQEELHRYRTGKAVIQQTDTNPLVIFNRAISARFYVLITSFSPLRAYIHSSGILYDQNWSYKKIPGRTWPLSQFWHYLVRTHGEARVSDAKASLDFSIVQTLLITEAFLLSRQSASLEEPKSAKTRCPHCFQLLGIDVMFNATLWPTIVDINGQPNLRLSTKDGNYKVDSVKRAVVEDMIALLFTPSSVATKVANSLENVSSSFGILGINCQTNHNLCLSVEDLEYIMQSQREQLNSGGFRQVFPSEDPKRYEHLLDNIHNWFAYSSGEKQLKRPLSETGATQDIVSIMSVLKKSNADRNVWSSINRTTANQNPSKETAQNQTNPSNSNAFNCSKETTTLPYLWAIFTHPKLQLTPAFSPLVTEYIAEVPYQVLLVRVGGIAENCLAEVHIDEKYGPTGFTNYTLGVGANRIIFHVVDISHKTPWVINTYSLIIHRQPITYGELPFDPISEHRVCSLKQECEMQITAQEHCGIHKDASGATDWRAFMSEMSSLKICDSGDAPGRWILPCGTCADRSTCFWREVIWHPYYCRYPVLSKGTLSQCLANKKLLFIGDSTNRGIMEYIMERVNGTLTQWDKTHDIRVYNNLNGGRTSVSFAYYPQFWLPTKERPVFEKAVYQIIQKSRPVMNDTRTVLVVGGVHWLATQHLLMLLKALKVERLQGIKLFVKSLGSGFHQMVEGIRSLTVEEQRKLLLHNRDLADFSRHYNFEVIDTFNMTVSRYMDFLQGKCACHFHRVTEVDVHDRLLNAWDSRVRHRLRHPLYHVEGTINAIYSEILLGRICAR